MDYAFSEMEKAGYTIASAYTAVKDPARTKFVYRDLLWTGADMIGLGVASFSHVNGTHYQNEHDWEPYIEGAHRASPPIYRALTPNDEERMIREFILQMKLGRVRKRISRRSSESMCSGVSTQPLAESGGAGISARRCRSS